MRDYYIRLVRTSNNGEVKYTYALELAFLLELVEPNTASGDIDPRASVEEFPSTEHLKQSVKVKQELLGQQQLNNGGKCQRLFTTDNGDKSDDQRQHLMLAQQTQKKLQQQGQQQKEAIVPDFFATSSGGDIGTIGCPSSPFPALRRKRMASQQALASDFAPAGLSPAAHGAEDDAELFGRRVAKFLRSLSNGRRRRRACIGFEQMMMEYEAEEEEEQKPENTSNKSNHPTNFD
ncbi:hypothetical protein niasHS_017863 [Heterodera schachtii]|uniref:Uncharacterized protein n=1 Tax=Heterodera schachtii TaxID=97005 RepID=A0ABD2HX16_HETSC